MRREFLQLELFPESPYERNARELLELRASCDKLRKSLHARNGTLQKKYDELRYELDTLKSAICKGRRIDIKQEDLFDGY